MKQLDWAALREDFPALARYCYLDTATVGPVSNSIMRAAAAYYAMSNEKGVLATDYWYAEYEGCLGRVANLINASPLEVGIAHNTSSSIMSAALLFQGVGRVLVAKGEHPSVVTPWQARGYDVDFAEPDGDGFFSPNSYERAITPDTRVIAVSHVRYNDGQVNDLGALGILAKAHSLHLVVDATQSCGVLPVDASLGIDIIGFAGFKWLNAGHGSGAIYVRNGLIERYGLPIAGRRSRATQSLRAVESFEPLLHARAFELGSVNFSNVMALGASIERIQEIGLPSITRRVGDLTEMLTRGLNSLNLTSSGGFRSRGVTPIVSFEAPAAATLQQKLSERGVIAASHGDTLRLAVSWYNNESDINHCLNILDNLT